MWIEMKVEDFEKSNTKWVSEVDRKNKGIIVTHSDREYCHEELQKPQSLEVLADTINKKIQEYQVSKGQLGDTFTHNQWMGLCSMRSAIDGFLIDNIQDLEEAINLDLIKSDGDVIDQEMVIGIKLKKADEADKANEVKKEVVISSTEEQEEFLKLLHQIMNDNAYYHVNGEEFDGEKNFVERNDEAYTVSSDLTRKLDRMLHDKPWKIETKPIYSYSKSFDNFEDMLLSLASVSFSVADAINPTQKRVRKPNGQVFTVQEVEKTLFENAFFDAQVEYGSQLHFVRIGDNFHYTTVRNFAFGWTVENGVYTGYVAHPFRDDESFGPENSTLESSCLVHGYTLDIQK